MARTKGRRDTIKRTRAKKQDAKERLSLRLKGTLLKALKEAKASGAINSINDFVENATEGAAKAAKILET